MGSATWASVAGGVRGGVGTEEAGVSMLNPILLPSAQNNGSSVSEEPLEDLGMTDTWDDREAEEDVEEARDDTASQAVEAVQMKHEGEDWQTVENERKRNKSEEGAGSGEGVVDGKHVKLNSRPDMFQRHDPDLKSQLDDKRIGLWVG